MDFVSAHFHTNIGVVQIAAASGQSRRWLEDAFRRELNCSPAEFLQRRRVSAVVRHIREQGRSGLGIVAEKCGFSGTRQLNASFEREMRMSVKRFAATEP